MLPQLSRHLPRHEHIPSWSAVCAGFWHASAITHGDRAPGAAGPEVASNLVRPHHAHGRLHAGGSIAMHLVQLHIASPTPSQCLLRPRQSALWPVSACSHLQTIANVHRNGCLFVFPILLGVGLLNVMYATKVSESASYYGFASPSMPHNPKLVCPWCYRWDGMQSASQACRIWLQKACPATETG